MLWVSLFGDSLLGFKLLKERSEGLSLTRVARNSDSPTRKGVAQAHLISEHSDDCCSVSTPVTRNGALLVGPANPKHVIDNSEVVNLAVAEVEAHCDVDIVRILGNDTIPKSS